MSNTKGEPDVLIVGAGFGGVYTLHRLRQLGCSVKVFEAGSGFGGIWFWNCYPGARVDSNVPLYELSIEELWKDWTWSEKFPGYAELREYFHHVDTKLDLKKDIHFNTRVVSAHYDTRIDRWDVKAEDGTVVRPRFLLLCLGFAAKKYIPPFTGLENFQGICHHTAAWPQEGVPLEGKRVAVIGTGATGVQVIQEVGPIAGHLTVFQRTPNTALPMAQSKLDKRLQQKRKPLYPTMYRRRLQTFTGYDLNFYPHDLFSVSPEECRLYMEDLWGRGGVHFIASNYQDVIINEDANKVAYDFWKEKVRERLHDPVTQEILAPTVPPHPFGTKRPSLEQTYYEVYNQPNVKLVNLQANPIAEITSDAIITGDGVRHEVDVIVLATGFDSVTGGITQIDIRGVDGTTIKDKWASGVYTNLGMTTANFPNMFFTYGPQAPTALSNGPTCIVRRTVIAERLLTRGLFRRYKGIGSQPVYNLYTTYVGQRTDAY
ncbi:FAD/NAD(P)-binding domain-containing protein [Marasmius fiardii PR-910]|nr:FAD/NAD(P)-binding domain-containing protein [Marasmius fiardii PR-910]